MCACHGSNSLQFLVVVGYPVGVFNTPYYNYDYSTYGYRTDNKKPPVTYRFLNLSVILDLCQAFSFYPSLADAN